MNIVGQLGPLVGTRLYPDDDAPYYVKGMVMCGAFMLAVIILAVCLRMVLKRENERKSQVLYQSLQGEEIESSSMPGSGFQPRIRESQLQNII